MSDIVEKTLLSLQSLIGGGTATSGKTRPAGLQNVLEVASGLASKHDEDKVMKKELGSLLKELSHPRLKSPQTRECLVRAIYCEMLGYPAPFAHIHAIKQAQLGSVAEKRIGYLAATLMLHYNHELVILIVNTIQKDLKAANVFNICMALTACTHLIGSEMASSVVDLVEERLSHQNALVRRRAVLVIHHFLSVCPSSVRHVLPKIRAAIGDRDPGVVAAVLHPLYFLADTDPDSCIELIVPLVEIQRQIIRRKLPSTYDYNGVPAPWIQLRILKILALLSRSNVDSISDQALIRHVIRETLLRTDVNQNCAHAIVHQCICTVSSVIGAHRQAGDEADDLVESAFASVGRFLESHNPNMKYVGIKALTQLVKCLSPGHLAKQQAAVMECLQSPDWSIRRNTLDVLFELTTASNIQVVCPKMLKHLSDVRSNSSTQASSFLKKIFDLVDRYRPSNDWFLKMSNELLLEAGHEILLPEVIAKVKDVLLSNAPGDENLRTEAVAVYLNHLERRHELQLSPQMLLLSCWAVSHYPVTSDFAVLDVLTVVARETAELGNQYDDVVVGALTALEYLVIRADYDVNETELDFDSCLRSSVYAVKDRADELQRIIRNLKSIRPLFVSAEDHVEHDWALSFVDQFVVNALDAGESPYRVPSLRRTANSHMRREVSYKKATASDLLDGTEESAGPPSSFTVSTISDVSMKSQSSHHEATQNVWSKDGLLVFTSPSTTSITTTDINIGTSFEMTADNELLAKALFGDPIAQNQKAEVVDFSMAAFGNNGNSSQM